MSRLLPLFPFVAALSLLACQRDGPVSDDAAAPPDNVVGDASASGIAAPANSAAAEAGDRAAMPQMSADMAWVVADDGRAVRYGPRAGAVMLTIGCVPGGVLVTRHHPAPAGSSATLSFTGAGHAASLPVTAAVTKTGPEGAEWQGRAIGDMARGIERPFVRDGQVEISLGGAPSLVVPAGPDVRRTFAACLGG